MNIDKKALKHVIEQVEASRLRQKAETEFQRDTIKAAVKNHNLDGKAIRIVLQRRAMGDAKRDEQDYFVHSYEVALAGKKLAADALENGATIREAAAIGGISTGAAAALAKGVQKSEKIEHNPETGEITETSCGQPDGGSAEVDADETVAAPGPHDAITETEGADLLAVAAGQPSVPSVPAEESVNPDLPSARLARVTTTGKACDPAKTSPGGPEVARVAPPASDDDLTIPPHLRGPSPANRRAV